jgi:peptidyl-prolyl cis-trans isomerase SurA
MIDQKIMLEMAELDSIVVDEKEVNQALDQQIQMLVAQAGSESQAEDALGQPIKDFRREFWYDMKDRMISERYQQQLLSAIVITRSEVKEFYKTYKDSLPVLPMLVKVRHLQIPIKPGAAAKEKTKSFLSDIAKTHSLDPSKNNGGELGWVKRGSLVKNFETAAFTIELGEISDPIETEFGYHILETLEKQGDKIRVRHVLMSPEITKDDNERAFNLAFAIKDSAATLDEFKELVKKYSSDKTTIDIGGDLGWIDPTNYAVPEIGQAIKYIELGSCSPPINSSVGFHLLWVGGLKKGGRPNLQDHWAEVESMALNKKKMDWYQGWISNARKKFHIQITSS